MWKKENREAYGPIPPDRKRKHSDHPVGHRSPTVQVKFSCCGLPTAGPRSEWGAHE
jgi:hypothetical protein